MKIQILIFLIPQIDEEPLLNDFEIDNFSEEILSKIHYKYPYRLTKNLEFKFEDYEKDIKDHKTISYTDEIFPLETRTGSCLSSFISDSSLQRLEKVKTRSTDLFRNTLGLKYRFEKDNSKNEEIKCVKNTNRLDEFLLKESEIFTEEIYELNDTPNYKGQFEIDFKKIKYPACVRSLRLLSKLYEDMIYQFSVKMKDNEIIVRDNGLPFGFILYPGRGEKTTKTTRTYRLFFRNDSEGLWKAEETYGEFSVSRSYTEDLENIRFKSNCSIICILY